MLVIAINAALAALAVSLLIVVHEFGHFLCARAVGMRVEVFSLGFWKKIVGLQWGETEYRLSIIPLGGYVRVAGESPDVAEGKPDEFWSKTPGQRAIFVLGGVTMNFLLALVLFVVAFGIGVPFPVAEVGDLEKGQPAWEAGLQRGDRIVAVDGVEDPVFPDLAMKVALSGEEEIRLKIRRGDTVRSVSVKPRYSERHGMQTIGVFPPALPVVTALTKIEELLEVPCPAGEAGIEPGDRILAVNGIPVESARSVHDELLRAGLEPVELRVARGQQQLSLTVRPKARPHYGIGISGGSSRIKALQPGGIASRAGFQTGDHIVSVNGQPVRSRIGLERAVHGRYGEVGFGVRAAHKHRTLRLDIPDAVALEDFLFSMEFGWSNTLEWVGEGTPADEAGLQPGDTVTSVGGQPVESWEDILAGLAGVDHEPVLVQWEGQPSPAYITAQLQTIPDSPWIGVVMERPKTEPRRYGPLGAVKKGISSTIGKLVELVQTLKAFFTRRVSTRQMGSIVMIAQATFHAAEEGFGKLFYLAGYISAALAFFNLLPIPVLDGGHLLFLLVEKLRGQPLSERVMVILQTAGLVLLLAVLLYATRNDILRIVQGFG